MSNKMMTANVLTLLALFFLTASGQSQTGADLARLVCSNKRAELTRISQARTLLEHLRNGADTNCAPEQREAILSLGPVLELVGDVCTAEITALLQEFHAKYMAKDSQNKLWVHLPRAVSEFVVGLGLQTSRVCKKNMINSLIVDSASSLNEADYELMQTMTNDKDGLLERMDLKPRQFNDLILAKDLLHGISINDGGQPEKLLVSTKTGPKLRETQVACRNRFKPFYDKLIIPLVNLADMGYDYDGEEMKRELNEIRTNKEIGRWYRTVYLCEILLSMEVFDESRHENENSLARVIRILSKEEAAKLMDEANGKGVKLFSNLAEAEAKFPPLQYGHRHSIELQDQVLDANDGHLSGLIKSFEARARAMKRVFKQLIRRVGLTLKDQIKRRKFFIIGRLVRGDLVKDETNLTDSRRSLMTALDDMITGKEFEAKPKIYQLAWWKNVDNIKEFLYFLGFGLQIFSMVVMINAFGFPTFG